MSTSGFLVRLILKVVRESKGITQKDLSKMTGISMRMISRYETNEISPTLKKIDKLAKALNVDPLYLIS